MSDIYKYRVGKKWYSFDKSILEPEDLRVFNLADWKDKLKIITIYQELKPSDNDDVVILKTKTEKPNKDKRAAEYRAKKQKLESELTNANKRSVEGETDQQRLEGEAEQQRLVKELKQLDIEYADIVNIQNADTVNIAKANQVILKDVNELIKETNDTLKELKPNLNTLDFEIINGLIENLLEATNKQQLDETITQIKNTLTQLNKSSLIPEVNKGVKIMTDTMEQLKDTIKYIKESETVKKLIDIGLLKGINVENQSYINTLSLILGRIENLGISEDDLSTLSSYPLAIDYLKNQKGNPFKILNPLCNLIRFYVKRLELLKDADIKAIGLNEHTDKTNRAPQKLKINITGDNDFINFFDTLRILNGSNRYDLAVKYGENKTNDYIGTYEFNKSTDKQGTYGIIKPIVDNKQTEEVDKPAAVEGSESNQAVAKADGFLGLKTNKAAKKEYEQLMDEITKLKQQVEQMNAEINDLKTKSVKSDVKKEQKEDTQIPLSEPTNSNDTKVVRPTFLTDITQGNTQLKHIEPQPKAPELTDLEKLLNRRRQDIEPDLTDSEDSEDWGAGVGGLLGELQRDLNKYGLVLSLSPDKNAYFINVFNRKKQRDSKSLNAVANGVAEASKLVNSVNQDTEYKDLKKLYEQLY